MGQSPVLVVGSVALDSVITPFGEAREVLGGSAVYFSIAASFFTNVRLVGVVGADFPENHIKVLKNRKIDLAGLEIKEGKTFRWTGRYGHDPNERETLNLELNVFASFQPKIPREFQRTPLVFLANINPELQMSVLGQIKKPEFVAVDTMNIWIEKNREQFIKLLRRVDMVVLNESEARQFSGEHNLIRAARKVLGMGPWLVIVKKGEHGAFMVSRDFRFAVPAYPLEKVCDPTGAGDCFGGGFMGYLGAAGRINEENLKKAVIYGTAMASFCCEMFSVGRLQKVTRRRIDERFKAIRNLSHI